MDGGTVEDPRLVRPGQEDVPRGLDALEHATVGSAADALGGQQTDARHAASLHHRPCLLVPVGHEVGLARDAAVKQAEQQVDVVIPEPRPQGLATPSQ